METCEKDINKLLKKHDLVSRRRKMCETTSLGSLAIAGLAMIMFGAFALSDVAVWGLIAVAVLFAIGAIVSLTAYYYYDDESIRCVEKINCIQRYMIRRPFSNPG